MGDGSITPRFGNMKALLGILAGAGASYGIYKLISGGGFKRNKKSATSEGPGVRSSQPGQVTLKPGSLLAKVSGLDVVCARPGDKHDVDVASGNQANTDCLFFFFAFIGRLQYQCIELILT